MQHRKNKYSFQCIISEELLAYKLIQDNHFHYSSEFYQHIYNKTYLKQLSVLSSALNQQSDSANLYLDANDQERKFRGFKEKTHFITLNT